MPNLTKLLPGMKVFVNVYDVMPNLTNVNISSGVTLIGSVRNHTVACCVEGQAIWREQDRLVL